MRLSFLSSHFFPALQKTPNTPPLVYPGAVPFCPARVAGLSFRLVLWGFQRHCTPFLFQQYKLTFGRFFALPRFHSTATQCSTHFILPRSAHSAPVYPVPRPAGAAIPLPVLPRCRLSSASRLPAGSGQGETPPSDPVPAPASPSFPDAQPPPKGRSHSRKSRKIVATKVASKCPRKS